MIGDAVNQVLASLEAQEGPMRHPCAGIPAGAPCAYKQSWREVFAEITMRDWYVLLLALPGLLLAGIRRFFARR